MRYRNTPRWLNEEYDGIRANVPKDILRKFKKYNVNIIDFKVVRYSKKDGSYSIGVNIDLNFGNGVNVRANDSLRDTNDEIYFELGVQGWGPLGSWNSINDLRRVSGKVEGVLDSFKNAMECMAALQECETEDLVIDY